jgi:hypothetical protein
VRGEGRGREREEKLRHGSTGHHLCIRHKQLMSNHSHKQAAFDVAQIYAQLVVRAHGMARMHGMVRTHVVVHAHEMVRDGMVRARGMVRTKGLVCVNGSVLGG